MDSYCLNGEYSGICDASMLDFEVELWKLKNKAALEKAKQEKEELEQKMEAELNIDKEYTENMEPDTSESDDSDPPKTEL